jgi:hypothetical protein
MLYLYARKKCRSMLEVYKTREQGNYEEVTISTMLNNIVE